MSDDETRKLILARRAKFVAAAIASVGIACGKTGADPQPCLSPPQPDIEQDGSAPQPCLSVPIPVEPVDAGNNIQVDPDAGPPPQPCLSPVMADAGHPTPQPCLKVKPPTPQPCLSVAPKPTK